MEEARSKFRTNIYATINEAKRCELDEKRDAAKIWRDQEFMSVYMEGIIDSLLGGAEGS